MKLFIFSEDTNYGLAVISCIAKNANEAVTLLELERLGWDITPKFEIEVNENEETRVVFNQ